MLKLAKNSNPKVNLWESMLTVSDPETKEIVQKGSLAIFFMDLDDSVQEAIIDKGYFNVSVDQSFTMQYFQPDEEAKVKFTLLERIFEISSSEVSLVDQEGLLKIVDTIVDYTPFPELFEPHEANADLILTSLGC